MAIKYIPHEETLGTTLTKQEIERIVGMLDQDILKYTFDLDVSFNKKDSGPLGMYWPSQKRMLISLNKKGNLRKSITSKRQTYFSSFQYESTIIHEFGHAWSFQLDNKNHHFSKKAIFYYLASVTNIPIPKIRKMFQRDIIGYKKLVAQNISQYATKNYRECFAELFTIAYAKNGKETKNANQKESRDAIEYFNVLSKNKFLDKRIKEKEIISETTELSILENIDDMMNVADKHILKSKNRLCDTVELLLSEGK